jgi:hyaluronan synthase
MAKEKVMSLPVTTRAEKTKTFGVFVASIVFLVGLHLIFLYKTTLFLSDSSHWIVKLYIAVTGMFLLSRFLIIQFYRDDHSVILPSYSYPTVSFVIAAKNEEDSIYRTVETAMRSEYPAQFECIVVNDGSTDATLAQMEKAAHDFRGVKWGVKVISFEKNRGKREAMAEGILSSRGEIIVFVDSDSFVQKDAVATIVEHFIQNPSVAAVSGNSGVENETTNALTKMQSARYGISFDIFKAAESVFGAVTCTPGCFSAYRKSALLEILDKWRNQMFWGTRSTFGDDRSLTNFVLRKHDVVYCQHAHATTIVPDTYKKFFKQQLRWKKSWIREGTVAALFIWRKNPVAAFSFYANLLLPIFSPFIVFNAFFLGPVVYNIIPIVFVMGIVAIGFLYGIYHYMQTQNRYWPYSVLFSVLYVFVLVWQMPYALVKLRDTKWGTR